MRHSDLVKRASRWLRAQGCGVVITEMASGAGQEPDVIGWYPTYSILIECKTSRSDFLSDRHKGHQRIDKSMGDKRYYLAPPGVIKAEELPPRWGLLEPHVSVMFVVKSSGWFYNEKNCRGEITLLVSAMRRIKGVRPVGVSVKMYTSQTRCRATIGILEDEADKKIDEKR